MVGGAEDGGRLRTILLLAGGGGAEDVGRLCTIFCWRGALGVDSRVVRW